MTRPDDIPEDVWEAAKNVTWLSSHASQPMWEKIARAILAERERCAKVAESYYDPVPDELRDAQDMTLIAAQNGIATAIRGKP